MGYSLSQIKAWEVTHLTEAADHWTGTADRWHSAFAEAHEQAHAVSWEGYGAEALRERAIADKAHVTSKADQLREAASVARHGAGAISAAQQRVLYAVEDAQNAGFRVEDDFAVIDRRPFQNAAQRAARRAQAQTFAAKIQSQVAELARLDNEVAAGITTAAGDIGVPAFAKPGHVQAVGHKCTDDQDDVNRKILSAIIGGAMIGGAGGAITGPGAIPGALVGGASAGILAGIDEATSGGERFSGCEG